jgi:molybdenum-dependent DNA-binding transcriptional regulator ModE
MLAAKDVGMATHELGRIMTIPQAAKRAGWSRWRMRRYLVTLNRQLNGMLLVNISRGQTKPIWTVSVAALRLVHPQWFQDPESLQRQVDDLREEQAQIRSRVGRLERNVGAHELRLAELAAG